MDLAPLPQHRVDFRFGGSVELGVAQVVWTLIPMPELTGMLPTTKKETCLTDGPWENRTDPQKVAKK